MSKAMLAYNGSNAARSPSKAAATCCNLDCLQTDTRPITCTGAYATRYCFRCREGEAVWKAAVAYEEKQWALRIALLQPAAI